MGLGPRPQIYRLVGFARSQGLTRFAVLAPRTPYGSAVVQAMQEATLRNGLELSKVITYLPDAADLSPEVRLLADYDSRRQALLTQRAVLAARPDDASKLALKRLDGLETLGSPDFDAVLLPEGGQALAWEADLIFLDINMPGISGVEMLRHLKDDARTKNIPTIMFTASLDPEDEKTCLELGTAGFVRKPDDWREYHSALEEVVMQHT